MTASVSKRTLRDGHQVTIRWGMVWFFVIVHLLALLACLPMFFSWSALVMLAITGWATMGLGVCLGFHRLLTHRSYATRKWIEYTLTVLGSMTWEGSPLMWVGTHRLHHAESDQPGDPHSPNDGFGWAHMFWLCYTDHPGQNPRSAAQDLARDPVMRWLDRWWWVGQLALLAVLWAIGGWSWLIWGGPVRMVVTYHLTWFTNSAAHTWGYRNFATPDRSRNNWWLAIFSFGEGWHNNHHAQQRSAAHGIRWWEVDLTYLTIRFMEITGQAWKVVRPQLPTRAQRREIRAGTRVLSDPI